MSEDEFRKMIGEELDERLPKKISAEEKLKNARDIRDTTSQNLLWAEQRSCGVADEFIRLEVQIATILFAFASLFLNAFVPDNFQGIGDSGIFMMKLAFSGSIFLLISSLAFGLLHLKINERFWDNMLRQRIIRFKKWGEVSRGEISFEEADAYQSGTSLEKGNTVSLPDWTWILQTICLGLAIFTLFILAMIFMFARQSI